MARLVTVAGVPTGIPNVYQNKIDLEGGSKPGVLESGVVCLIGPCEGAIQPKVPYFFRSPNNLKEFLGEGELYDAARFAFKPSREDPQQVRGASKVIAVRANPAVQGSLDLESAGLDDLINLTSVIYGIKANQISAAMAAGTLGGPSKKITVAKMGENDEVGDNLGFLPAFIIRYTGDGDPATMTITRTALTTALTGPTDGSANLNISFATYNTITKLVAYINAQTGYEAVAVTNKPDSYLCQNLDFVTAVDIKTISGTVTTVDDSTENVTTASGLVGLGAGDVLRVGASDYEYMYVKTAGTPNTAIRGYQD
ncbi:MAG: hypothetical protein U9Q07_03340, partial [Planctomycetota bacterium]|nr:hypothetical protein [Planctomycetota bacterium]